MSHVMSRICQCVAVCCSMLQYVAVCCSALQCIVACCNVLQCVVVRCSVLQCVATVRCIPDQVVVQCVAAWMRYSMLQCGATCSRSGCGAVCCSLGASQCVAVRCSAL